VVLLCSWLQQLPDEVRQAAQPGRPCALFWPPPGSTDAVSTAGRAGLGGRSSTDDGSSRRLGGLEASETGLPTGAGLSRSPAAAPVAAAAAGATALLLPLASSRLESHPLPADDGQEVQQHPHETEVDAEGAADDDDDDQAQEGVDDRGDGTAATGVHPLLLRSWSLEEEGPLARAVQPVSDAVALVGAMDLGYSTLYLEF
jgi:hypothetical protein